MRSIRIGRTEISIECLKDTEFEKWLYLPLDVLLNQKGVLDRKIVNNSVGAIKDLLKEPIRTMDIMIPYDQNSKLLYSDSIKAVTAITIVMGYKENALQKCNYMLKEAQRAEIEKQLLDTIHRNAELSYWNLLSLTETEEQDAMLERMIQKRRISAIMTENKRDERFVRWLVEDKNIGELHS